MKMAVWFSRHAIFLLFLMGAALLGACGGDTNEDLIAPALTVDAVAPSTFTPNRPLSGTVEAGADLSIDVSTAAQVGEIMLGEGGTWTSEITGLKVGSNLVTVTADDSQGNTRSLQLILVYDLLKIDQADTRTAQTSSTVYGRLAPDVDANTSITSATLNGTEVSPSVTGDFFSLTLDGLVSGNNTVRITAENAAGDTQTIPLTIVSDATAVLLSIDKPLIPIDVNTLDLTGTVEDGGSVAFAVAPEASVGEDTDPGAGSWRVTLSDLEERDSIVTVTATLEGKTDASAWTRVVVATSPTVTDRVPTPPANDVLPGTLVKATFSEAVVASKITFQLQDGVGRPVAGAVAYDAEEKSIIFTPAAPLAPGSYTATISGVKDPEGNPVTNPELLTWSFTVL